MDNSRNKLYTWIKTGVAWSLLLNSAKEDFKQIDQRRLQMISLRDNYQNITKPFSALNLFPFWGTAIFSFENNHFLIFQKNRLEFEFDGYRWNASLKYRALITKPLQGLKKFDQLVISHVIYLLANWIHYETGTWKITTVTLFS